VRSGVTDAARMAPRFYVLAISHCRNELEYLDLEVEATIVNASRRARSHAQRIPLDGAASELATAIVLHRQGRMVIMDACKLCSRRRGVTTACAVLPTPGIVE